MCGGALHGLRPAILVLAVGLAGCAPEGDTLYVRAELALRDGDAEAAVLDLKNLLQAEPQHAEARALLGRALLVIGDVNAAAIELKKASDLGAARSLTLLPGCQVLVATGEFEEVLAECRPGDGGHEQRLELTLARALALLGLKRDREARAQFQAVLDSRPDSLDALLGLADATATVEGLAAAREVLEQAPAAVRKDERYWLAVGGTRADDGDLPGAEQAYRRAKELSPRAPNAARRIAVLAALADAQLRQGKIDEAVETSEDIVKVAPRHPLGLQARGQILAAAGRLDDARGALEQAVAAAPDNQEARLLLGLVHLRQDNLGQAEMHFASVVATSPDNARAQRLLAETRARLEPAATTAESSGAVSSPHAASPLDMTASPSEELATAGGPLASVQEYLGRGDLGKARAVVDEAARESPDSAAVSNARGLVLVASRDLPGALESFQRANTLAPKVNAYALNLARAHLLNRDLDAALRVLDELLQGEPMPVPALVMAVASTLQAGQLERANGYVERLRQSAPAASVTHRLEGDLAMRQGRFSEALGHYRKVGADGRDSVLVVAEYEAARRAGEPKAHQVLENWLVAHPKDASVSAVLADDRQRRGDAEGAINLYEGVLALLPNSIVALNNLAVLYHGKADPRALETARKAHELAPGSPEVQDTYGWLLVENGRLDEGLELLRNAVRRLPDNAEVQYHYAAVLARKGNAAEAVEILKQTALSNRSSPETRAHAERLLLTLSRQ